MIRGVLKIMEAKDLNCFGLEPEHIQCLLISAIDEKGPANFVGLFNTQISLTIGSAVGPGAL